MKTFVLIKPDAMKRMTDALPLVKELSDALSSDEWLSTQTTAYALIALARHAGIGGDGLKTGKIECRVTWNGGEAQTVSSEAFITQMPLTATGASGKLLVENTGQTALYPRLIVSGIPAPGTEKAASNGLELRVNYSNRQNEAIAPDAVEQGQDFFVTVTVKNTSPAAKYEEVALTQIFPSGWEIRNARLDAGETNAAAEYQDIRDDRIYTYFDISAGETKTFKAEVHAAYLGKFYLPMTTVETMYDAAINARVVGKWVQVVAPGTEIPVAPPVETPEATPTPSSSGANGSAAQDEARQEREAFGVWRGLNKIGGALATAILATGGGEKTFVTLGFTNLAGNFTPLGASLSIRIADKIDENANISEISFSEEALTQIALSGDVLREPDTLTQLGKLSGADVIVTGMYLSVGDRVHVTASAWNAADGAFIAAASASAPPAACRDRQSVVIGFDPDAPGSGHGHLTGSAVPCARVDQVADMHRPVRRREGDVSCRPGTAAARCRQGEPRERFHLIRRAAAPSCNDIGGGRAPDRDVAAGPDHDVPGQPQIRIAGSGAGGGEGSQRNVLGRLHGDIARLSVRRQTPVQNDAAGRAIIPVSPHSISPNNRV